MTSRIPKEKESPEASFSHTTDRVVLENRLAFTLVVLLPKTTALLPSSDLDSMVKIRSAHGPPSEPGRGAVADRQPLHLCRGLSGRSLHLHDLLKTYGGLLRLSQVAARLKTGTKVVPVRSVRAKRGARGPRLGAGP